MGNETLENFVAVRKEFCDSLKVDLKLPIQEEVYYDLLKKSDDQINSQKL